MNSRFKMAFFDLDGLLVDSEKVYNLCWREAFAEIGLTMTYEQALELRSMDRRLAEALVESWYGEEARDSFGRVRERRKVIMNDYFSTHELDPKPGVREIRDYLDRLGIEAAIVTASPVARAKEYLMRTGIDGLFETIVSVADHVERGKPFPDVYLYASRKFGVDPSECVVFEDSPNGLKSAHSAGMTTVMIPDLTPFGDDVSEYADMHFDRLDEVRL